MKMTKHISNIYFEIDDQRYRRQLNDKVLNWFYQTHDLSWIFVPELRTEFGILSHIKLENMYINFKREHKLVRILD